MTVRSTTSFEPAEAWLDLLKDCLTREKFPERLREVQPPRGTWKWWLFAPARISAAAAGMVLARRRGWLGDDALRGFPAEAETMIGRSGLDNVHECVRSVLRDQVPGDFIETGVWRGGTCIFIRAALAAYGATDRTVWVADSFSGLPRVDRERFPADSQYELWRYDQLAVSLEAVRENFRRYGLLDEQVRFLPGLFRETLERAPIERLALLRLDGDLFESTWQAMSALYHKVSPGGWVIVDDYGALPPCRAAIEQWRAQHRISAPLIVLSNGIAYWRREG